MRTVRPLSEIDHVLVAFEGPLCTGLPKKPMAARLKLLLDEPLPHTEDPLAVLRHAATHGPATAKVLHQHLKALEYEAVNQAVVTVGAQQALDTLTTTGTAVTVVSSLSVEAVRSFLVLNDLTVAIKQIAARTHPDTTHLPPSPHLLEQAIHHRGIPKESCVLVAMTREDVTAAGRAGVPHVPTWAQLGIDRLNPVDNSSPPRH